MTPCYISYSPGQSPDVYCDFLEAVDFHVRDLGHSTLDALKDELDTLGIIYDIDLDLEVFTLTGMSRTIVKSRLFRH